MVEAPKTQTASATEHQTSKSARGQKKAQKALKVGILTLLRTAPMGLSRPQALEIAQPIAHAKSPIRHQGPLRDCRLPMVAVKKEEWQPALQLADSLRQSEDCKLFGFVDENDWYHISKVNDYKRVNKIL